MLGKTNSAKTFLDGKTTHGCNFYNHMDSTILKGKSTLTTINIKSSKKLTCVGSSFLILLEVEKILDIIDGET
jgi:hypothetical protein